MSTDAAAPARPLTASERNLLHLILSKEFDSVGDLRAQADRVLAYSSCLCGCGSIGFEHPNGFRPGPAGVTPKTRVALDPIVSNQDGQEIGGLILFLRDGLLDDLEVYSYGSDPLPLPQVERVRFVEDDHQ